MYIDYLECAREIPKSFRHFLTKKQSLKVQGCNITTMIGVVSILSLIFHLNACGDMCDGVSELMVYFVQVDYYHTRKAGLYDDEI